MWNPVVSAIRFQSNKGRGSEETSTGKWLVPIPFGKIEEIWEPIEDAAALGKIAGAKISSRYLDQKLGHHLACVYCRSSDRESVAELLHKLRNLGIDGTLRYKTCRATIDRREEFLWTSDVIESLVQKP